MIHGSQKGGSYGGSSLVLTYRSPFIMPSCWSRVRTVFQGLGILTEPAQGRESVRSVRNEAGGELWREGGGSIGFLEGTFDSVL